MGIYESICSNRLAHGLDRLRGKGEAGQGEGEGEEEAKVWTETQTVRKPEWLASFH